MSTIRLDLTLLPPTARRSSLLVLRDLSAISSFIATQQWVREWGEFAFPDPAQVTKVGIFDRLLPNLEIVVAGCGFVKLANGAVARRILVVRCLQSELALTRNGLEELVGSYLTQLAGQTEAGPFWGTEFEDGEEEKEQSQ
jgi:hypothetical protein